MGSRAPEVPAESWKEGRVAGWIRKTKNRRTRLISRRHTPTITDNIKNDILDVTYIFHTDSCMKNGVMPSLTPSIYNYNAVDFIENIIKSDQ